MRKNLIKVFVEIFLVVSISFSFSYLVGENFDNRVSAIDFENMIPAGESSNGIDDLMDSLGGGIGTCKLSKDGKKCQEYFLSECDERCTEPCVRKGRKELDNDDECKLGLCFDAKKGSCAPNSPKDECEEKGGEWFAEDNAEGVEKCEKHCCILKDQALFVNERTCEIMADSLGLELGADDAYFDSDITAEPECIDAVYFLNKSACVFPSEEGLGNSCRFTTSEDCNSLGGRFSDNYLCSHPDLETVCKRQNTTGCVEGRDEVFWFDSCGNRENIYDSDRDRSWNNGKVLSKEESCVLGSSGNFLENQETCGNCYRFLGSMCGNASENDREKVDAPTNIVCRDMGCMDGDVRREHGETWCSYQSAIGVSADVPFLGIATYYRGFHIPGLRAMAAPGSEHFRKSCIDGEIEIEACSSYRNGICVESRIGEGDKEFSTAACRPNRWAECLAYNTQNSPGNILSELLPGISMLAQFIPAAGKLLQLPAEAEKVRVGMAMLQCEKDPDCFVNNIGIDDFKFPLCEPKYPAGFYEAESQGEDEKICSFGTQTCSSVWVYESTAFTFGTTAKWECKANCGCVTGSSPQDAQPSMEFVKQMNDICVSLGDCGAKANYVGGGGFGGYQLKRADYEGLPKEGGAKNKQMAFAMPPLPYDDSRPIPGKYIPAVEIEPGAVEGGEGSVGAGTPDFKAYDASKGLLIAGLASGGTALGITAIVQSGGALGIGGYHVIQGGQVIGIGMSKAAAAGGVEILGEGSTAVLGPSGAAFQAGAMGAAIAVAVTSLLVGISGIGAGVGVGGVIAYMGTAAVSGAMIGVGFFAEAAAASLIGAKMASMLGPIGIVIAVILIADIIAQWIAGVGEVRTAEVTFECLPWQPPLGGGDCEEKCGQKGFPCTKYGCETLGQACQWVAESEGPNGGLCINAGVDDMSGPRILGPLGEVISEGFGYTNVKEGGFRIESEDGECATQFDNILFGFETDEYARCRMSGNAEAGFEEMVSIGSGGKFGARGGDRY